MFNRLTDSRKAIVDEQAGVTRDRHYGKCEWNGKEFTIIDTGGYIRGSDDVFEDEIRKQVKIALDESSVVIFVVDVNTGITDLDKEVANIIRKSGKKIFLAVNKVDTNDKIAYASDFYSLGLGEIYTLSSINGSGTGELLDAVVACFPDNEEDETAGIPRFAVVGRPNVGKSSFVNALLGEERHIVTDIAGTTRDSIHTHYKGFGHEFILVDTAGIRKKSKVKEDVEFYSVMRTIRAIEDCDVCLVMVDAQLGFDAQDLNILSLAEKNRKGVVIVINKWDLMEKDSNTPKKYEEEIKRKIAPFIDIPVVFVSAVTKQRVLKAIEEAEKVYHNRQRKIPTSKLNDVLLPIVENFPPPSVKGKFVKIKFIKQLPTLAPSFAFYCNLPQYVPESYSRFVENKMREHFDFNGVPIQIFFRQK